MQNSGRGFSGTGTGFCQLHYNAHDDISEEYLGDCLNLKAGVDFPCGRMRVISRKLKKKFKIQEPRNSELGIIHIIPWFSS